MISFENCDITINGTGIIAETAVLTSQSPVNPLKAVGNLHPVAYSQVGAFQNSLQVTYIIEPLNEPNYTILTAIKNSTGINNGFPLTINIGGISGTFYLDSYTAQGQENNAIKANVTYISFSQLSGILTNKSNTVTYNSTNSSGISHYWTAAMMLQYAYPSNMSQSSYYNYNTMNIRGFNYSVKSTILPFFGIGYNSPVKVNLTNLEENIEVVHEWYVPPSNTGMIPETGLNVPSPTNYPLGTRIPKFVFALYPLSYLPIVPNQSYTGLYIISLSDGLVKTNRVSHNIGNMAVVNTVITRTY